MSRTLTVHQTHPDDVRIPGPDQEGGSLSLRIGGLAGEGIDTAGDLFAKAAMHCGWRVWTTRFFPSRIRGGLTTYTTRFAGMPIAAPSGLVDVMVTLHQDGARPDQEALVHGGLMVYDSGKVDEPEDKGGREDVRWLGVDCTGVAKEIGNPKVRNTVALGAAAAIVGMDLEALETVITERFGGDPTKPVVQANHQALRRGAAAVPEALKMNVPPRTRGPRDGRLFLAGNEAFAFGALAGGCRFYAGYPITPATTIMEALAERMPAFGGTVLQVEDELAAINMAIGAGFAGVRAMTATSGPGLSLMAEAMGLAGSTETPVVIVDCMRPGPSTGMPTKTAQEDLGFLIHGGHGEIPHIVLAAEDLDACYRLGIDAFNLAEHYQCPVYVTIDAALALGKGDTEAWDLDTIRIDRGKRFTQGPDTPGAGAPQTGEGYARYAETEDGIPLRAVPGDVGGRHYTNSTEHGPTGYTTEIREVRTAMVERRNRKLADIDQVHEGVVLEGDRDARLGVVAFGSTVPVAREALALSAKDGVPGELLVLRRLLPLPLREVTDFFERHGRVLVAEGNSTGQLLQHLRAHVADAHQAESLLKYDGEPFRVAEILSVIMSEPETDVEVAK